MDPQDVLMELQRIGLGRVLQLALKHHQSRGTLGKPTADLTVKEQELLEGLTGKPRLDLQALDQALRSLKYQVSLLSVLEALHGGPVHTQREKKQRAQDQIQTLLEQVEHKAWKHLLEQGQAGFHLLKKLCVTSDDPVFILKQCEAILQHNSPDRRPVVATQFFGHAHALDSNEIAGKLIEAALKDLGLPQLERDGVSSTALVAHLKSPDFREAVGLPWRTVMKLNTVTAHEDQVFIVENPAVFEALLDAVTSPKTLICTSGQPSHALMALLERFPQHTTFHVNTDFDVGGLRIAHRLKMCFEQQFRPWRFDAHTLQWAREQQSGFHLSAESLAGVEETFPNLVEAMKEHALGMHQEILIPLLLQDLHKNGC